MHENSCSNGYGLDRHSTGKLLRPGTTEISFVVRRQQQHHRQQQQLPPPPHPSFISRRRRGGVVATASCCLRPWDNMLQARCSNNHESPALNRGTLSRRKISVCATPPCGESRTPWSSCAASRTPRKPWDLRQSRTAPRSSCLTYDCLSRRALFLARVPSGVWRGVSPRGSTAVEHRGMSTWQLDPYRWNERRHAVIPLVRWMPRQVPFPSFPYPLRLSWRV